uniref:Uncharacterized protein n=1 Tax=Glossina pallidipes TaxID=7398 RepID=A0A1A9ZT08_GLOPL
MKLISLGINQKSANTDFRNNSDYKYHIQDSKAISKTAKKKIYPNRSEGRLSQRHTTTLSPNNKH